MEYGSIYIFDYKITARYRKIRMTCKIIVKMSRSDHFLKQPLGEANEPPLPYRFQNFDRSVSDFLSITLQVAKEQYFHLCT